MNSSRALGLLRPASWLLGLCSILLPAAMFAYYRAVFSNAAAAAPDPYICGLPLLGAMVLCLALAVVLSLAALMLALADCFRLPRPRPARRWLEAIAVGWVGIALPVVAFMASLLD
jgi:hypothetical protein